MLIHNKNFNLQQIADSGQCFRMNRLDLNRFSLIAYDRYLELCQVDTETVEISCSEEEFYQIWEDYFDLGFDYHRIYRSLSDGEDNFLKEAAEYGKGIRILRQEPFEMLISYIISQNKNIPSIKCCIERICEKYGEEKISPECGNIRYYTFPKPEKLAQAQTKDLRDLKLGYRDEYIIHAANAVVNGDIVLQELIKCSYEEAFKALKGIRGIGDKVANCVSLYGLHHIEAFPVDVWISRVLKEIYDNRFDAGKYKGYAGIVQQYMFYYMRHLKSA